MKSGGEACTWNVGELWWFNNKLLHEAYNPGDTWRVHVIFDILPAHMKPWAARLDTMVRKQVNTIENDIHVPHL
jgi:aspartyl/asparaginyl beta-hydroxylase (cupin superfamily)